MEGSSWMPVTMVEALSCGGRFSSLRFSKPDGFDFTPGQYTVLRVETADGPVAKPFTLGQAPADPYLEFTTRISGSAFKRSLAAMSPGDPAEVAPPRGTMVLPPGAGRVAFLAGGVGITPAHSIIRDAAQRGSGLRATLLYGNVDDSCVPYLDEFESLAEDGRLDLVMVYERPPAGWGGEAGLITPEIVRRHVDLASRPVCHIAGPPVMVDAMTSVLDELDVPEESRIVERFAGY